MRQPRFTRPLKSTGVRIEIPSQWSKLRFVPACQHEVAFVEILSKYGMPADSPIPLVGRYSKARPWSAEELAACIYAHQRRIPVALMSAALNRNPQDIIYRLLDACDASGTTFREVGLGSERWTPKIKAAARDLFDAGLTAWRIGALFGVDFEGVEKAVYSGRPDYGHAKRNPFAICTDHKQDTNRTVLAAAGGMRRVLDAFAGEGRFAAIVEDLFPGTPQVCIEKDVSAYDRARRLREWATSTRWILDNNIEVMKQLATSGERFNVIDLDPFVSCREQVDLTWPLLEDRAHLFVTFGGEYRRSFIRTNRKAIQRRYGFHDSTLSNSEYLELVPGFFLGWLAAQASASGFVFEIECCVRYPNNCRFWLRINRAPLSASAEWLSQHSRREAGGVLWNDLRLPRFSELRKQNLAKKTDDKMTTDSLAKPAKARSSHRTRKVSVGPEQMAFETWHD